MPLQAPSLETLPRRASIGCEPCAADPEWWGCGFVYLVVKRIGALRNPAQACQHKSLSVPVVTVPYSYYTDLDFQIAGG